MAAKLLDLIQIEPGESPIDLMCDLGCGRSTKTFVRVVVKGARVDMGPWELERRHGETVEAKPALDVRTCPVCYNTFVWNMAERGQEMTAMLTRNGS